VVVLTAIGAAAGVTAAETRAARAGLSERRRGQQQLNEQGGGDGATPTEHPSAMLDEERESERKQNPDTGRAPRSGIGGVTVAIRGMKSASRIRRGALLVHAQSRCLAPRPRHEYQRVDRKSATAVPASVNPSRKLRARERIVGLNARSAADAHRGDAASSCFARRLHHHRTMRTPAQARSAAVSVDPRKLPGVHAERRQSSAHISSLRKVTEQ
jgi:hypothetical protein